MNWWMRSTQIMHSRSEAKLRQDGEISEEGLRQNGVRLEAGISGMDHF